MFRTLASGIIIVTFLLLPQVFGEPADWSREQGTRVDGAVPFVMKLSDGRFRLYYCGAGMMSATSSDGVVFVTDSGVRVNGGCDPSVVRLSDGSYRMYYKVVNRPGGPGQGQHDVYSAISKDALSFVPEGLRINATLSGDNGWASVPEAIKLPDGRVRIYYVTANPHGTTSAISTDGLQFIKEPGLRITNVDGPNSLVDPAVLILPTGMFLMIVSAFNPQMTPNIPQGIYVARSEDGLNFKLDFERKIAPDSGLGENELFDPTIIRLDDGSYRIYFGAADTQGLTVTRSARWTPVKPVTTQKSTVSVDNNEFTVTVASNSTISNMRFSVKEKRLTFAATGEEGFYGTVDITIPNRLLNGTITTLINQQAAASTSNTNQTHAKIHLNYTQGNHTITVTGTNVVPEFPSYMILLLTLTTPLLIIAASKGKTKPSASRVNR